MNQYYLGSTASCRGLLRSRLGPFDEEHSLLDKHFTLKNILANMAVCKAVLKKDEETLDRSVVQSTAQVSVTDALEEKLYEFLEDDEEVDEVEDCLRIPWGRTYSS